MSKTITLTIGERMAIIRILDGFKGSITALSAVLDDVKKIGIQPEEWDAAGRTITKTDAGEQWKWNETDEKTWKEIVLEQETVDYIKKDIKEKSDKGEITISDTALVSLNKKLE